MNSIFFLYIPTFFILSLDNNSFCKFLCRVFCQWHFFAINVIVDHNGLQIDGSIEEVNSAMPIADKFAAFKFHVIELADGNDMAQVRAAFEEARSITGKPVCIVAETVKGKGVSFMEGQVGWHGKAPNDEQFEQAMAELAKEA